MSQTRYRSCFTFSIVPHCCYSVIRSKNDLTESQEITDFIRFILDFVSNWHGFEHNGQQRYIMCNIVLSSVVLE
jgi:hypothetical protein